MHGFMPPEAQYWIAYCGVLRERMLERSRRLDRGEVTLSHVIWAAVGVTIALGVTGAVVAAVNRYKAKIR